MLLPHLTPISLPILPLEDTRGRFLDQLCWESLRLCNIPQFLLPPIIVVSISITMLFELIEYIEYSLTELFQTHVVIFITHVFLVCSCNLRNLTIVLAILIFSLFVC